MTLGKIPSGLFSTGLTTNGFDTHKDLITAAILDRMIDMMDTDGGIFIADTSETSLQVVDAGGGAVNIKAGVAWDKFGQRIYLSTDNTNSGQYVGTVDLSSNIDLGTVKYIKIDIDNAGSVEVDCQGKTPAATTIDEILAAINAAGFGTVAFRVDSTGNPLAAGDYIMIKSSSTGGSSEVEFVAPAANDATLEIFGLSEGAYPHTYVGGSGFSVPDTSGELKTYDVIIEYLNIESSVGTFEGGYPAASDTQYTRRDDSYKITVQLASVGAINDADQHELLIGQVVNDGGTLTITDKRADIILRLKGVKFSAVQEPAAPVMVSLEFEQAVGAGSVNGYIVPTWEKVVDTQAGISEYIIRMTLTESFGTTMADQIPFTQSLVGFDITASQLSTKISLPLGNKYLVEVAARDNTLNKNLGAFVNAGEILVGGTDTASTVTMPAVTLQSIEGGVLLDWVDIDVPSPGGIFNYEYAYTLNETQPQWGGNVYTSNVSEVIIQAAPGTVIKAMVRARLTNMAVTDERNVVGVAGGAIIGLNGKIVRVQDLSVLNTDDGKSARFLTKAYLPNPAAIVTLIANITAFAKNASDRGIIRIYRDGAESEATFITFGETGVVEQVITDANFSNGIMTIDAWDNEESGSNQAAFTVDMFSFVYVEGQVPNTGTTQSSSPTI